MASTLHGASAKMLESFLTTAVENAKPELQSITSALADMVRNSLISLPTAGKDAPKLSKGAQPNAYAIVIGSYGTVHALGHAGLAELLGLQRNTIGVKLSNGKGSFTLTRTDPFTGNPMFVEIEPDDEPGGINSTEMLSLLDQVMQRGGDRRVKRKKKVAKPTLPKAETGKFVSKLRGAGVQEDGDEGY